MSAAHEGVAALVEHEGKSEGCAPRAVPLIAYIPAVRGSGGMLWPAARALSLFISSGKGCVKGARVLELGAGTHALPGLSAAIGGAACVVITDVAAVQAHHEGALEANASALEHCTASVALRSAVFLWGSNWRRSLGAGAIFDIVLAADVISLDDSLFPFLRKTFLDAARANERVVLLIASRERASFEGLFWEGLVDDGWVLERRDTVLCEAVDGEAGAGQVDIIAATMQLQG